MLRKIVREPSKLSNGVESADSVPPAFRAGREICYLYLHCPVDSAAGQLLVAHLVSFTALPVRTKLASSSGH
jgi:hypothetical protein